MAILEILHYPDPRLRNSAEPVTEVDDSIRRLVKDMFETMYDAPGIGLASIQVNVPKRVIVVDVSEEHDQPLCLINPEILVTEGEETMDEGCLSVPGFYETVQRAEKIRLRALCWTKWITSASPARNPPIEAKDLLKVPMIKSTWSVISK